jgi:DNA polymerase-3 subunit epsilon
MRRRKRTRTSRLRATPKKSGVSSGVITALPDTPGVYLFYGGQGELLYVGKSRRIRTRVRSHFNAPEERRMLRKVKKVEAQETAGELGALLLESRLIKELRPMFNVSARSRRRIIVARRKVNLHGYTVVNLEPIDYLSIKTEEPVLGVFKHKTQAREFLALIAKTHRLCPKLLKLEQGRGYCFSYHLGQCDGACMGEENPDSYNARLEEAFEARRIQAWPYKGGVIVEEQCARNRRREIFLIDNWCLAASFESSGGAPEQRSPHPHRFDYDSYKILYAYFTNPNNQESITAVDRARFEDLCQHGFAAEHFNAAILPDAG